MVMPERIIHVFELVEVHEKYRYAALLHMSEGDLFCKATLEVGAVGKRRQYVVVGLLVECVRDRAVSGSQFHFTRRDFANNPRRTQRHGDEEVEAWFPVGRAAEGSNEKEHGRNPGDDLKGSALVRSDCDDDRVWQQGHERPLECDGHGKSHDGGNGVVGTRDHNGSQQTSPLKPTERHRVEDRDQYQ